MPAAANVPPNSVTVRYEYFTESILDSGPVTLQLKIQISSLIVRIYQNANSNTYLKSYIENNTVRESMRPPMVMHRRLPKIPQIIRRNFSLCQELID